MNFLRTAHGNGASALIRTETPPLDEIPTGNAAQTQQALDVREANGRPFQRGNRAASGRKPKLARLGVDIPDTADPRYVACLRNAKRYVETRSRELAVETGGISGKLGAGPSAMLASSGLALAASRFVYALAAEKSDPSMFTAAARLADTARQQELTAVALAWREAEARNDEPEDAATRERLAAQRARNEAAGIVVLRR